MYQSPSNLEARAVILNDDIIFTANEIHHVKLRAIGIIIPATLKEISRD
jgi:hypothetical protein